MEVAFIRPATAGHHKNIPLEFLEHILCSFLEKTLDKMDAFAYNFGLTNDTVVVLSMSR